MSSHMMDGNKDITCRNDDIRIKPNTFHEAFCKTGIDPEGLTRMTLKQTLNSK